MTSLAPSVASDEKRQRLSFLHRRHKHNADTDSLASSSRGDLPQYATGIQLETMSTHKSSIDDDAESISLPAYDSLYGPLSNATTADGGPASLTAFRPTLQVQLDSKFTETCSAFAGRPDPTIVYMVSSTDGSTLYHEEPALMSLRTKRGSNSCTLVTGQNFGRLTGRPHTHPNQQITVGSTVYRFGPGRPPRVALFSLDQQIQEQLPALVVASETEPAGTVPWDKYEIHSKSIFNRVMTLRMRLGTYEWRYGTSAERKALSKELIHEASRSGAGAAPTLKEITKYHSVHNLMVLERVTRVYGSTDNGEGAASVGKPTEVRRPVARLIRSKALRTPGTSSSSVGNGGRLQMDLSEWMPSAAAGHGDSKVAMADEQTDRDMAIALIVSSCITMLKREIDRRTGQE